MRQALVVGYGSIGKRHCTLLEELGLSVSVVSRRECKERKHFYNLLEAIEQCQPDYIVIANETSLHFDSLRHIDQFGFKNKVLIEKPVFSTIENVVLEHVSKVCVAYNLRFHPIIDRLGKALEGQDIISAQVYCGQYLPDWRPSTDYKESYSADKTRGGGVLRDLSHELDYILWLFGRWKKVAAIGGHFSSLHISSDDCWSVLMETERCRTLTLQLNYLDRPGQRKIVVNTDEHTFCADLMMGTFTCDGRIENFDFDGNKTYMDQHCAFLTDNYDKLCSLSEGAEVLNLIQAVEKASCEKSWILS